MENGGQIAKIGSQFYPTQTNLETAADHTLANVNIDGETFTIDSAADAVNSNSSISVNADTISLASGDDGIHANSTLVLNRGSIQIT